LKEKRKSENRKGKKEIKNKKDREGRKIEFSQNAGVLLLPLFLFSSFFLFVQLRWNGGIFGKYFFLLLQECIEQQCPFLKQL